jgi:hypothetical protein
MSVVARLFGPACHDRLEWNECVGVIGECDSGGCSGVRVALGLVGDGLTHRMVEISGFAVSFGTEELDRGLS